MTWTAEKIRDLFISIVKEAAKTVKEQGHKGDQKVDGDTRANFATVADQAVAKIVREKLKEARFPTILDSEDGESVDYSDGNPQFYTSCDELDGTENARRGRGMRPFVTILCAFDKPKPRFKDALVAVLFAHHTRHMMYAIRNKGCYFQEPGQEFIKVSSSRETELERSTAGRVDLFGSKNNSTAIVKALQDCAWLKDFGASGFHFMDLAIGGCDFYVNTGCKGEEAGPGYLVTTEAGCSMITKDGNNFGPEPFTQNKRYNIIIGATEELAKKVHKALHD